MGLNENFREGLVFGFDLGTGSIGFAVRRGSNFLEAGVEICPPEGGNLEKRRNLRRLRRTIRNRNRRLRRLREKLESLGLPRPDPFPTDCIALRCRAVLGEPLTPPELHAAVFHLLRRRGYARVPWRQIDETRDKARDKELGEVRAEVERLTRALQEQGLSYPCQFLAAQPAQRRLHWPRALILKEFEAICEAQKVHHPALYGAREDILYGRAHKKVVEGETFHVYFKATEARDAGIMALRWPRFNNRSPALDAFRPYNKNGRPQHVVRTDKEAYVEAQFELAIMNFRLRRAVTRQVVSPPAEIVAQIRALWDRKAEKRKSAESKIQGGAVRKADLKKILDKWNKEHPEDRLELIEGQTELTPLSYNGRAAYASPTLRAIRDTIQGGGRIDPPQPRLRFPHESPTQAVERLIRDTAHPTVKDRLGRLSRLLAALVARHGTPDLVVVEAIRELGMGDKKKKLLEERRKRNQEEREEARAQGAQSKKEIRRYRLWKEMGGLCPYCDRAIEQSSLADAEIEHIVPYRRCYNDESYNVTIAHRECNAAKGDRTPFEAFHGTARWAHVEQAAKRVQGRKRDLLLSPVAEELIESARELSVTAYITKAARQIILTQLDRLTSAGKEPATTPWGNEVYQVTNGAITAELRRLWGLDGALHHEGASDEERARKNRSDLRHHALDAMVIASTLPLAATRSRDRGGWRYLDAHGHPQAENPFQLNVTRIREMLGEVIPSERRTVGHHAIHYKTTYLGRRKTDDGTVFVARDLLTGLKPEDFAKVYPAALGRYLEAAWKRFEEEGGKPNKGKLPEAFIARLCFSHFQRWRAKSEGEWDWPQAVRIPIRSVRYQQATDPDAVVPLRKDEVSRGTRGEGPYIKREDFREVRVYRGKDGKLHVVHVPHSRHDPRYPKKADLPGEYVRTFRKGDVVQCVKGPTDGTAPGNYRIAILGSKQVQLIPALADTARFSENATAWGVPKTGSKPSWQRLFSCIGLV